MTHLQTFSNIFGQDKVIQAIRHAYLADRLPHGLIFAGPIGVGKAMTAAALGKLFLCDRPDRDLPCGTCESCRVFQSGNHPDYHVITKELIRYHDKSGKSKGVEFSIQVLRPELIEPASRKPLMGRGKMFVIEQADSMNPQAQNAILKTLEEPAGRTIIILLTDQSGSLLHTIRSRCQLYRFSFLPMETVLAELARRGIDPSMASDAARFAEGSLGVALRWIADGVISLARELVNQLDDLLAGRSPENLPSWFKSSAETYAEKQLERDELASKDQANREGLNVYLRLAAGHFRNQLVRTDDVSAIETSCAAIESITRAEKYLDANVNVSIVLQQLAMSLSYEFRR